jgi:hypothetical protein
MGRSFRPTCGHSALPHDVSMGPLLFVIALASVSGADPRAAAIGALDKCLIKTASRLRAEKVDQTARYRSYAVACSKERAEAITQLLEASTALASGKTADLRWRSLESIIAKVDERYRIWAVRELEKQSLPRDPGMEIPAANGS